MTVRQLVKIGLMIAVLLLLNAALVWVAVCLGVPTWLL